MRRRRGDDDQIPPERNVQNMDKYGRYTSISQLIVKVYKMSILLFIKNYSLHSQVSTRPPAVTAPLSPHPSQAYLAGMINFR